MARNDAGMNVLKSEEKKMVEAPVSNKIKKKINDLLKELQAKGMDVKTESDVVTYLLDHFEEPNPDPTNPDSAP